MIWPTKWPRSSHSISAIYRQLVQIGSTESLIDIAATGNWRKRPHQPPRGASRLPPRIQISHHYPKHLPGHLSVALRKCRLRAALGIAIRPRHCRHAGRTRCESVPLRNCKPRLERPVGNLLRGHTRRNQRTQSFVLQRVGDDGLQNSARSVQRQIVVRLLKGAPAVNAACSLRA